jgi:orotate phosphoribosyltransferase
VMRRGFTFQPGEKVLVVEDVITRGGRVHECLEIVKKMGGTAVAVAVLVDRSSGQAKFEVPCYSLLEMSYPTYPADQVPEALAKIPATKPGS